MLPSSCKKVKQKFCKTKEKIVQETRGIEENEKAGNKKLKFKSKKQDDVKQNPEAKTSIRNQKIGTIQVTGRLQARNQERKSTKTRDQEVKEQKQDSKKIK